MPRLRLRPVLAVLAVVVLAGAAVTVANVAGAPPPVRTVDQAVRVPEAPGSPQRIAVDTTVYLPQRSPASAVLVSPGFGGDKDSVATQARELAERGFVALAYTPRGFGRSGGRIELNSPDGEVADARALVGWLAARPEVRKDAAGDPRVGVTGGSYGGALALMLAGTDRRIDAVAAAITYHDLSAALLPNNVTRSPSPDTPAPPTGSGDGVFKRSWAGNLFAAGFGRAATPGASAPEPGGDSDNGDDSGDRDREGSGAADGAAPGGAAPGTASGAGACGRFGPRICRAYTRVATTGRADPATTALLRRHSPVSVASNITAPTMLLQGERDTLFGLDQAQANARQIAAAGTTVRLAWYAGGHDGGRPGTRSRERIADWLAFHLDGTGTDPGTGFSYQVQGALRDNGDAAVSTVSAGGYPGIGARPVRRERVPLGGPAQVAGAPPGGAPAALSNLPGIGSALGGAVDRLSVDVPGQFAAFRSAPLHREVTVAGAPTVRLTVAGVGGADEAVLFAKLYDVGPDGTRVLPGAAVAPLRVRGLASGPRRVGVQLPGIVQPVQAGHRLALVVSTTDSSYATPNRPYSVRISLAGDRSVALPVVPGSTSTGTFPTTAVVGIAALLAAAGLAGGVAALRRRWRRRAGDADVAGLDAAGADIPLSLRGLAKVYGRDLTVVDDLSFEVRRGQVVGLLGPNGAGKTTALRTVMGLVRPSAGEVRMFGHPVRPGAPVLSRVGSFVEGSGFLPHLSGLANLRLYWRATGRPASESRIDEALRIADLGDAVRRRVGTYSQGMRQRLAIAQAMLGLPEMLILDEPTNGLDPPQIHHMRGVLRDYAAAGRTVLISSHLLAEVEQTCTHVVVMHRGRLVATGPVDEVVAGRGEATFEVDDPVRAARVLRELPGASGVHTVAEDDADAEWAGTGEVHAALDGLPRSAAVRALVGAGVGVARAGPRRRLEDAFLQLVGDDAQGRP